jgi:hypothetical protein
MKARRTCLDDDISRVAAALTAVPSDEDFTARMNRRIDAAGTPSWWWVAPAVAASVLVLAVAANVVDRTQQIAPLRSRAIAISSFDEARVPIVVQRISTTTARAPAATRSSPQASRESLVPAIAALDAPATLSVEALSFPALSVAPVEFETLDLPGLELRDIDAAQPKEQ